METNVKIALDFKRPWRYILEIAMCILLVGIVFTTFTQVLFRYVFQWSLAWTEELSRFLFLWLAALSVAYGFKTKAHFALKFVVNQFSPALQSAVSHLVSALLVLFLSFFSWQAILYTLSSADQIGPSTGLSMSVPYSSSIAAGLLMLMYVVKNWLMDFYGSPDKQTKEVPWE